MPCFDGLYLKKSRSACSVLGQNIDIFIWAKGSTAVSWRKPCSGHEWRSPCPPVRPWKWNCCISFSKSRVDLTVKQGNKCVNEAVIPGVPPGRCNMVSIMSSTRPKYVVTKCVLQWSKVVDDQVLLEADLRDLQVSWEGGCLHHAHDLTESILDSASILDVACDSGRWYRHYPVHLLQ